MGTATEYTLRQILDALADGNGAVYPHSVWSLDGISQFAVSYSLTTLETTLRTVPDGKEGFLTSLALTGVNKDAALQYAHIVIRKADDSVVLYWAIYMDADANEALGLSFPTPVYLEAGWKIRAGKSDADVTVRASITGYEL